MSSRIDLYSKIHKAQRAWLMRAMFNAGRVDTEDVAAVRLVSREVARLADHIREHGEHEERFIHPLLVEVVPDVAARIESEHHAIDSAIEQLGTASDAADATTLYSALAGFVAQYFPHLDLEERQAMPALLKHFDDSALIARVMRPFMASRSTAQIIDDLNLQIGSLNPDEERQLLTALLATGTTANKEG